MTAVDELNLAGIMIAGSGSTLAMFGAYMQMNGYFAFKPGKLFDELRRILSIYFVTKSLAAGRRRIGIAATLAGGRENRATSLIGFYCVLFGFFLQTIGSILLVVAVLHGSGRQDIPPTNRAPAIVNGTPCIESQRACK